MEEDSDTRENKAIPRHQEPGVEPRAKSGLVSDLSPSLWRSALQLLSTGNSYQALNNSDGEAG